MQRTLPIGLLALLLTSCSTGTAQMSQGGGGGGDGFGGGGSEEADADTDADSDADTDSDTDADTDADVDDTGDPWIDEDGDGSPLGEDCDDTDPERYPGALETACDGIDQDCDGADLLDGDGDGFECDDDCDDDNGGIHPEAPEVYGNGTDDNCDGVTDECEGTNGLRYTGSESYTCAEDKTINPGHIEGTGTICDASCDASWVTTSVGDDCAHPEQLPLTMSGDSVSPCIDIFYTGSATATCSYVTSSGVFDVVVTTVE